MKLTPTALFHHARSDAGKRHMRYIATSGFGVGMTQILLFVFQHAFNWSGVVSNITAVTLTAVPAFMLNKYWVWGKRGKAHLRKEVLPFWLFTVAGLILSTISVAIVVAVTKDPSNPDLVNGNKYAVQAANIVGFGVLWVLKFMFLDKIMFGDDNHTPYDEDMEREEAALDAAAAAGTTEA